MKNIAQLCETAHEMSKSKGFWKCNCEVQRQDHHETASCVNLSLDMKITLIRSELSEALEEFRRPDAVLDILGYEAITLKPIGFMSEIADAAIRIFDLAGRLNIGSEMRLNFERLFYRTRPVVPVGALMEEAHYNLSWIGGMLIQDNVAKAIPLFVRTLVVLEDLVTTVSAGKGRGDLDEAIITKMAYNSKRPFRHGKTC